MKLSFDERIASLEPRNFRGSMQHSSSSSVRPPYDQASERMNPLKSLRTAAAMGGYPDKTHRDKIEDYIKYLVSHNPALPKPKMVCTVGEGWFWDCAIQAIRRNAGVYSEVYGPATGIQRN